MACSRMLFFDFFRKVICGYSIISTQIMEVSHPFFKLFTASGLFILLGLTMMILGAGKVIRKKEQKAVANNAGSLL